MKYIQAATERMQAESATGSVTMDEPSLLERVLKAGNSEKLACIMALDLILVGIDTVSGGVALNEFSYSTKWFMLILEIGEMNGCSSRSI